MMGLKSRTPQNAHLGSLLNVHTKFQFRSSIRRRDREGTVLFQVQKEEKHIYPLIIDFD